MVTVSLQEKSGIYQAVLNYKDDNGKRKQKWVSTKLKVRGNKKQALAKAEEIRANFEKKLEFKNLTDQLLNLIEASKGDELELIILLTVHYGLRRSEVLGLKWDAIDFKNKTLTIKHTVVIAKIDGKRQLVAKDRTKNKSSYRTLPLIDTISIKLQEQKAKQETFKKI